VTATFQITFFRLGGTGREVRWSFPLIQTHCALRAMLLVGVTGLRVNPATARLVCCATRSQRIQPIRLCSSALTAPFAVPGTPPRAQRVTKLQTRL
jgi:hypothetical protein